MTKFTKLEVAEINLRSAVRLFFEGAHPVTVETVVAACAGVLRDVAQKDGKLGLLHDKASVTSSGIDFGAWRRELHEAQNFFKHADRDPTAVLDYVPEFLHFWLLEACDLHRKLVARGKYPIQYSTEGFLYELWFAKKYPHVTTVSAEAVAKAATIGLDWNSANPDDLEVFAALTEEKLVFP